MLFDTTVDTTQGATRSDGEQPPANKSAYLNGFCNSRQRPETDVVGLWLRRARVRGASVILPFRICMLNLRSRDVPRGRSWGHLDTSLTDTVLVEQIDGIDRGSLERVLGDLLDTLGPTIQVNPLRVPLESSSEPELGG